MAGLWRECPGVADEWEEPDYDIESGDSDLGGTTYTNIGPVTISKDHPCTKDGNCFAGCQGCSWVLIPEAEQMGVLVRAVASLDFTHVWFVTPRHNEEWCSDVVPYMESAFDIHADTPEEALAAAILQALGVQE